MTPINLYDIWQKIQSRVNVQQNGQIRPVSDFQLWMNSINNDLFHELCGDFQVGQQITDELSPFLKTVNIQVTKLSDPTYDLITLPSDYEYLADIRVIRTLLENTDILKADGTFVQYADPDYASIAQQMAIKNLYEANVEVVDNQRWSGCQLNKIQKPTYKEPKATQYNAGFKLAPKGIQSVVLDYFKTPRSCVFGYTITNDVVIYVAGSSTQLEWTNVVENMFLTRLEEKYGVRVRDQQVWQTGNAEKKELK